MAPYRPIIHRLISELKNEPPLYPYPAPGDITLEDIVPAAMDKLSRPGYVPGMQPGEKVLFRTRVSANQRRN